MTVSCMCSSCVMPGELVSSGKCCFAHGWKLDLIGVQWRFCFLPPGLHWDLSLLRSLVVETIPEHQEFSQNDARYKKLKQVRFHALCLVRH